MGVRVQCKSKSKKKKNITNSQTEVLQSIILVLAEKLSVTVIFSPEFEKKKKKQGKKREKKLLQLKFTVEVCMRNVDV